MTCAHPHQAISNFTRGVLTFDIRYIFRTPPGYHLLVTGPSNNFKDGVAPMTAVVETDWLPYTFTFNYQFTRPCEVIWQAGEPYAQICVIPAGLQEEVQPVIRDLGDNPDLVRDLHLWTTKRSDLLARQKKMDRPPGKKSWDKDYYVGRYADGRVIDAEHRMKMRLKSPIDERFRPEKPVMSRTQARKLVSASFPFSPNEKESNSSLVRWNSGGCADRMPSVRANLLLEFNIYSRSHDC